MSERPEPKLRAINPRGFVALSDFTTYSRLLTALRNLDVDDPISQPRRASFSLAANQPIPAHQDDHGGKGKSNVAKPTHYLPRVRPDADYTHAPDDNPNAGAGRKLHPHLNYKSLAPENTVYLLQDNARNINWEKAAVGVRDLAKCEFNIVADTGIRYMKRYKHIDTMDFGQVTDVAALNYWRRDMLIKIFRSEGALLMLDPPDKPPAGLVFLTTDNSDVDKRNVVLGVATPSRLIIELLATDGKSYTYQYPIELYRQMNSTDPSDIKKANAWRKRVFNRLRDSPPAVLLPKGMTARKFNTAQRLAFAEDNPDEKEPQKTKYNINDNLHLDRTTFKLNTPAPDRLTMRFKAVTGMYYTFHFPRKDTMDFKEKDHINKANRWLRQTIDKRFRGPKNAQKPREDPDGNPGEGVEGDSEPQPVGTKATPIGKGDEHQLLTPAPTDEKASGKARKRKAAVSDVSPADRKRSKR